MSGLTTGVGPENGGCYRERMQRARRTLPNCYRRHEGMKTKNKTQLLRHKVLRSARSEKPPRKVNSPHTSF